jgi:hypothetical protein
MRRQWASFYPDLSRFEKQLRQLETANLRGAINDGVRYAQSWLPANWQIPNFYFAVIPNGGSPAFALDGAQGFDFLQLSQTTSGDLDLDWLVTTVSHESHHLGMESSVPAGMTSADRMAYKVLSICLAEGVATYFISGSPSGRVPGYPGARFHLFTNAQAEAWNRRVAEEEEILQRQAALLDRALNGKLTEDELDSELRDYWLNGLVGRAYVLGAEMFGAIFTAFGKQAVLIAMQDSRLLFEKYSAALAAKPNELQNCVPIPDRTLKQVRAIGSH